MKKILTLQIIGVLIFLSSCTVYKYGSKVTVDNKSASAKVEYKSYNYLINETKKKSTTEMWDEKRLQNELEQVPKGGYVIIHITASTIGAANTEYWSYVIKDMDGQEITRKHGDNDIPEYTTSQYGTTWWNIDLVPIMTKINGPFKVFVVDELMSRRSEYTVYPDQQ